MFLKKCLFVPAAGLVMMAIVACSQSSEPEEVKEPVSPVAEEAPAAKAEKSVRLRQPKKTPRQQKAEPREEEKAAAPPVAPEAPEVRPVEVTAPFVPSAPGKRISRVNVPGPYVAVTFDDGPHATLTPQVLDIFNRHGARATFFVLGRNANRHRSILARAVAEGHEIGAHSWTHLNMRASGTAKIKDEFDRTNAVIAEATGSAPKVMRPPYGSVNKPLINMVYNRYGTPAIMWDVDTNDWRKPGVQTVINRAVNKAKPGSIILLHDIHPSTVAAVEGIVTGLQARGFKLVTVSELIAMGRRAAGATAPERTPADMEGEPSLEPASGAPVPSAPEPSPLQTTQQQQPLPEGGASIGGDVMAPSAPLPATPELPVVPESTELDAIDES